MLTESAKERRPIAAVLALFIASLGLRRRPTDWTSMNPVDVLPSPPLVRRSQDCDDVRIGNWSKVLLDRVELAPSEATVILPRERWGEELLKGLVPKGRKKLCGQVVEVSGITTPEI